MEVQPYGSNNQHDHQQRHQFPNSHSYPYGYSGGEEQEDQKKKAAASSFTGLKGILWKSDDAEAQRKRRVATYKRYKYSRRGVKESVKRSVRWFRVKCFRVVYRWW